MLKSCWSWKLEVCLDLIFCFIYMYRCMYTSGCVAIGSIENKLHLTD